MPKIVFWEAAKLQTFAWTKQFRLRIVNGHAAWPLSHPEVALRQKFREQAFGMANGSGCIDAACAFLAYDENNSEELTQNQKWPATRDDAQAP